MHSFIHPLKKKYLKEREREREREMDKERTHKSIELKKRLIFLCRFFYSSVYLSPDVYWVNKLQANF
jgi:hypothetical protein